MKLEGTELILNQETLSFWKTLRFKNFAFDLKYVTSKFETNRSVLDFMGQEYFARPSPKAIGKVLVNWNMVLLKKKKKKGRLFRNDKSVNFFLVKKFAKELNATKRQK